MPNTNPHISVLILSYNFERFIREAVESVLAQSLPPSEIVICDDCSRDGSWDVIIGFTEKYPDLIRAHRHEKNLGGPRNAEFAAQKATGEFIVTMDGDDRWLSEKLELEWKSLASNPDAAISYSGIRTIDVEGKAKEFWPIDEHLPVPKGTRVDTAATFFESYMQNFCRFGLMRKSVLTELGGADENVKIFNDWDLMIRASRQYGFAYSGKALVEYRYHEEGIHNRPIDEAFRDLLLVYTKNFPYTDRRHEDPQDRVRLSVEKRIIDYVVELKEAGDERLRLITQLTKAAEERLAEIESLTKTAEERLGVIRVLDAEVKRLGKKA